MAIVVVLVGQCGNQLGDELFTQLALCTGLTTASATTHKTAATSAAASPASPSPSPFFTRDGIARCVLVDTEPKVVQGVRQRHTDFMRGENVIHGQSGRGNNWGLGYHGVKTAHSRRNEDNAAVQRAFRNIARDQREDDDNVLGRALQAIYKETRRTADAEDGSGGFEAILIIHSLVGGTGSGLASRLTERLRLYFAEPPAGQRVDEVYEATMMRIDGFDGGLYGAQRRARHVVNIAVAPQVVGEVATQGLNAALTLQVLLKHSDAILLLRNDDALAPGEAAGGSVCPGTSVLTRCVTFKEANEVLVAMLLPVLRYGLEAGCITRLLMQCIPPAYVSTTGGNKILTLLPTPQRSYAVLRQCVHRALFCSVEGGRAFMPGYKPTVPIEEMLSATAQQLCSGQPRRASKTGTGKAEPAKAGTTAQRRAPSQQQQQQQQAASVVAPAVSPASSSTATRTSFDERDADKDPYDVQRRLSGRQRQRLGFRTGETGGASRPVAFSAEGPFASSISPSSRRRPPVTPFSAAAAPAPVRGRGRVSAPVREQPTSVSRSFEHDDWEDDRRKEEASSTMRFSVSESREETGRGGGGEQQEEKTEELNRRVYQSCSTRLPPALYRHYQELRRAPVMKMFDTIDGVLLLNQALELDRRVLFPLMRSAALKVSTGAFMSSYEDVGVTAERVKRAVRDVAEVMANSEEL